MKLLNILKSVAVAGIKAVRKGCSAVKRIVSGDAGRAGLVVGGSSLAMSAHATALDVTSVTDAITATLTPIGVVGLAVLVTIVSTKVFKWIARAL